MLKITRTCDHCGKPMTEPNDGFDRHLILRIGQCVIYEDLEIDLCSECIAELQNFIKYYLHKEDSKNEADV